MLCKYVLLEGGTLFGTVALTGRFLVKCWLGTVLRVDSMHYICLIFDCLVCRSVLCVISAVHSKVAHNTRPVSEASTCFSLGGRGGDILMYWLYILSLALLSVSTLL